MGETAEAIAKEKWEFYFKAVLSPTVKAWLENTATPSDGDEKTFKLARSSVNSGISGPPIKSKVVLDNSGAKSILWTGFIALFLGIGMISTEPIPLGVLFVFASIWLFVSASSKWMTLEKAEAAAEESHARAIHYWEKSRDDCVEEVIQLWSRRLHLTIAKTVGVPARLQNDFAKESMKNKDLYKYEWESEIESWSSQPEFPEAPGAIPGGVTHQQYEQYCSQVLHSWGFLDAETTRYSRDGGIDVESRELVVQCKHYVGSVGVKEIREIFGIAAHKSKIAVVFSAGSYTGDAKKFASDAGVALFVLNELHGTARPITSQAWVVTENKLKRD